MATTLPTWTIDPGKWPRLVVAGQPVTEAQADEIIIRTTDLHYLDSNDKAWDRIVGRTVFGDEGALFQRGTGWFEQGRERGRELGTLNLAYLTVHRISSSWIGGPRGWCDWNGRIRCANYNIGKWPSAEEVGGEWAEIAEAFPYLDLTAQLISDEGAGELCAQWRISGGRAEAEEIGERAVPAEEAREVSERVFDTFMDTLTGGMNERGVDPARLQRAVAAAERRQSGA